jgi:rRNA maturation endonuclease Nob1
MECRSRTGVEVGMKDTPTLVRCGEAHCGKTFDLPAVAICPHCGSRQVRRIERVSETAETEATEERK